MKQLPKRAFTSNYPLFVYITDDPYPFEYVNMEFGQ